MEVRVIRSAQRRKTVAARQRGSVLEVRIPAWMSAGEEASNVADMVRRFEKRSASAGVDLDARAGDLARQYGLPRPRSIRWVDNQQARWGSCTPADGTVRISSRLSAVPPWVLDAVVVHELAHLIEASHGPRFKALVGRYPRNERALGFLIAKGMAADD